MVEGGQTYQLHWDQIGRPAMATDSTGSVVWAASYLPFGGIDLVYVDTGVLTQNLRFPGQWFQAETGLHQNGMRDYDPTTGRYLQADPLGLVDGPSVYGYARQSPLVYLDPAGMSVYSDIVFGALSYFNGLSRAGLFALQATGVYGQEEQDTAYEVADVLNEILNEFGESEAFRACAFAAMQQLLSEKPVFIGARLAAGGSFGGFVLGTRVAKAGPLGAAVISFSLAGVALGGDVVANIEKGVLTAANPADLASVITGGEVGGLKGKAPCECQDYAKRKLQEKLLKQLQGS